MAEPIDPALLKRIDQYIEQLCLPADESYPAALRDSEAAGLPKISISPNQGRLLYLLAKICGARRILEIGLLGGYSAMWLARALPDGGKLVSLELLEKHAAVARKNIQRAGLEAKIEIRVGPAMKALDAMIAAGDAPFDLIFIDADKSNYPGYLERSLKLSRPGTVLIGDNVIRNGKVLQNAGGDADLAAIQVFNRNMAENPRLESLLLPCFKENIDGFAIARVK